MVYIKSRFENLILQNIRISMILISNLLMLILEVLCWWLLPFLMTYAPNYIAVDEITGFSTLSQYIIVQILYAVITSILLSRALKSVENWQDKAAAANGNSEVLKEIRSRCIDLPFRIFREHLAISIFPPVILLVVKLIKGVSWLTYFKLILSVTMFMSMISLLLLAISKKLLKRILLKVCPGIDIDASRVSIGKRVVIKITLLFIMAVYVTALLGYSRLIDEKEHLVYEMYKMKIASGLKEHGEFKTSNDILHFLDSISIDGVSSFSFTQASDNRIITSDNSSLDVYLKYYINNPFDGDRIFALSREIQGIVMELASTDEGIIRAGVVYCLSSYSTIFYFLLAIVILMVLVIHVINFMSKSISTDISEVTRGLIEIYENKELEPDKIITLTSNDELGDLVVAFSRVRDRYLEQDKLKTEFFANLSHEFRTPLNVILGATQLLGLYTGSSPQVNSESVEKQSRVIKQNCLRLLRLVNNLIDSTRIEAGFYEARLSNGNLVKVISDITASVAEYIKAKDINLVFSTDTDEKIMAFDADKMERVMLNLLSNAIKFTDKKGSIYVNINDLGDKLRISVRDTGCGIPESKHKLIFERFRQLDRSLTRSHEGSGIGLSLVKSFVEMHNGTISVISEPGKGSEFIIVLPVRVADEKDDGVNKAKSLAFSNHIEKINVEFSDIYF